jgi:hypothetical protein
MTQLAISFAINLIVLALPVFLLSRLKEMELRRVSAYAGTLYILVYIMAITIPFHFQGYSTLQEVAPGEPLGWTSNWLIGLFAYLYTFKTDAFAWLTISIIMVAQGEFVKHGRLDFVLKSAVIVLASWILTEVETYAATVNIVLE